MLLTLVSSCFLTLLPLTLESERADPSRFSTCVLVVMYNQASGAELILIERLIERLTCLEMLGISEKCPIEVKMPSLRDTLGNFSPVPSS